MPILLDHLIVPSRDKAASAQFLGDLLGVPWEPSALGDHFAPVYVNETLTLDFADREQFESHHYCFHVSDAEFDAIFARLTAKNIPYRSTPQGAIDMRINTQGGGKNVYWTDGDGHNWEMLTVSYARPTPRLRPSERCACTGPWSLCSTQPPGKRRPGDAETCRNPASPASPVISTTFLQGDAPVVWVTLVTLVTHHAVDCLEQRRGQHAETLVRLPRPTGSLAVVTLRGGEAATANITGWSPPFTVDVLVGHVA